MELFSYISFFAFLVDIELIVYVLTRRPVMRLNLVCAALIGCFAIWALSMVVVENPRTMVNTAEVFNSISGIGFCSFSLIFVWFVLIFTGREKLIKPRSIFLFAFIVPAIFMYLLWTNSLSIIYPVKQVWGWAFIFTESVWTYLFYIYYIGTMIYALCLLLIYWNKEESAAKRKQALIILLSITIPLLLGSVTDVLCPMLKLYQVPPMAHIAALVWMGGIVYAIRRYKLFTITPYTAADNIVSTMADSLILMDHTGHIIDVNYAVLDLLGYSINELIGWPLDKFLVGEAGRQFWIRETVEKGFLKNYDAVFRSKAGATIPISMSCSVLKNSEAEIAGLVCIARDVTERKQAKQMKEKLIGELQVALANIKTLRGLVPICSSCKEIRDDQGYWQQVEVYVSQHTEADFSHGLCDECAHKLYPEYFQGGIQGGIEDGTAADAKT